MLKAQLALPACFAVTIQLLQNLNIVFQQKCEAGTRDCFHCCEKISSSPGLLVALPQRCHLEHICMLGMEVPPKFLASSYRWCYFSHAQAFRLPLGCHSSGCTVGAQF